MTPASTAARLCDIIRRVSKRSTDGVMPVDAVAKHVGVMPVDADVFRDLGVESTAALDLLLSLEDEFGISVPDDAFSSARTISKMTALIEELRGS